MNRILSDIVSVIKDELAKNLPDVKQSDLENDGAVFYMNGKNGTEFDWFVNEHLPSFMVFYDNKEKLGAVKADVYDSGDVMLYLYDDGGRHLVKEIPVALDINDEDLLALAVILRNNADEKMIWDADVASISTDSDPAEDEVQIFLDHRKYCEPSINRKRLMSKNAFVSKRIIEDGWKVGYMRRSDSAGDDDSGWEFYSGDEDDEYMNDDGNCLCYPVYVIVSIDPVLMKYIETPAEVSLVRVSSDEFEEDQGQQIHTEQWKNQ